MDSGSEETQISEARKKFLLAVASGPFNMPGTREHEEARRQVQAEIQPMIDASRRAEHISAEDLVIRISPPGIRFGIGRR